MPKSILTEFKEFVKNLSTYSNEERRAFRDRINSFYQSNKSSLGLEDKAMEELLSGDNLTSGRTVKNVTGLRNAPLAIFTNYLTTLNSAITEQSEDEDKAKEVKETIQKTYASKEEQEFLERIEELEKRHSSISKPLPNRKVNEVIGISNFEKWKSEKDAIDREYGTFEDRRAYSRLQEDLAKLRAKDKTATERVGHIPTSDLLNEDDLISKYKAEANTLLTEHPAIAEEKPQFIRANLGEDELNKSYVVLDQMLKEIDKYYTADGEHHFEGRSSKSDGKYFGSVQNKAKMVSLKSELHKIADALPEVMGEGKDADVVSRDEILAFVDNLDGKKDFSYTKQGKKYTVHREKSLMATSDSCKAVTVQRIKKAQEKISQQLKTIADIPSNQIFEGTQAEFDARYGTDEQRERFNTLQIVISELENAKAKEEHAMETTTEVETNEDVLAKDDFVSTRVPRNGEMTFSGRSILKIQEEVNSELANFGEELKKDSKDLNNFVLDGYDKPVGFSNEIGEKCINKAIELKDKYNDLDFTFEEAYISQYGRPNIMVEKLDNLLYEKFGAAGPNYYTSENIAKLTAEELLSCSDFDADHYAKFCLTMENAFRQMELNAEEYAGKDIEEIGKTFLSKTFSTVKGINELKGKTEQDNFFEEILAKNWAILKNNPQVVKDLKDYYQLRIELEGQDSVEGFANEFMESEGPTLDEARESRIRPVVKPFGNYPFDPEYLANIAELDDALKVRSEAKDVVLSFNKDHIRPIESFESFGEETEKRARLNDLKHKVMGYAYTAVCQTRAEMEVSRHVVKNRKFKDPNKQNPVVKIVKAIGHGISAGAKAVGGAVVTASKAVGHVPVKIFKVLKDGIQSVWYGSGSIVVSDDVLLKALDKWSKAMEDNKAKADVPANENAEAAETPTVNADTNEQTNQENTDEINPTGFDEFTAEGVVSGEPIEYTYNPIDNDNIYTFGEENQNVEENATDDKHNSEEIKEKDLDEAENNADKAEYKSNDESYLKTVDDVACDMMWQDIKNKTLSTDGIGSELARELLEFASGEPNKTDQRLRDVAKQVLTEIKYRQELINVGKSHNLGNPNAIATINKDEIDKDISDLIDGHSLTDRGVVRLVLSEISNTRTMGYTKNKKDQVVSYSRNSSNLTDEVMNSNSFENALYNATANKELEGELSDKVKAGATIYSLISNSGIKFDLDNYRNSVTDIMQQQFDGIKDLAEWEKGEKQVVLTDGSTMNATTYTAEGVTFVLDPYGKVIDVIGLKTSEHEGNVGDVDITKLLDEIELKRMIENEKLNPEIKSKREEMRPTPIAEINDREL